MLGKTRETAKLALRTTLLKADLGVERDPAPRRLVRTLQHLSIDTVLDVGANQGQFASLLRSAGFAGSLHSFEPLPDAFQILENRSRRDRRWTATRAALGSSKGTVKVQVSANSYSSSILHMTDTHLSAAPQSRVIDEVDAPLRRLDDVCRERSLDASRTLLKIDTQGYEAEVLNGAGDLLDRIAAVQLELSFVELYRGQALFDALREQLTRHGLTLWSLEPGIANTTGRMLQCDGVFVRLDGKA